MHARKHIAPAINNVGEARIVNDNGIKPGHIQGTLSGRSHGEKERLGNGAFQERANDANGLTTVIVRRGNARVARANPFSRLFNRRTRGHEQRHPAF